jgi:putative transposase
MPAMKKTPKQPPRILPKLPPELIDQLATGMMTAGEIEDVTASLKKSLIERALKSELGLHLGYPQGAERPAELANQRNGSSRKRVLTGDGPLDLDIPVTVQAASSRS